MPKTLTERFVAALLALTVIIHLAYVVGCGTQAHHRHNRQPAQYRDCDGRIHRLPIHQHDPTAKRGERTA